MNANELADGLEAATNKLIGKEYECGGRAITFYTKAATMLRQQQEKIDFLTQCNLNQIKIFDEQQAEIEALKKQVGIWEKETMNARIKTSLYQSEIEALKEQLAIMKNDLAFAGHDFNKIILQFQKAQEK